MERDRGTGWGHTEHAPWSVISGLNTKELGAWICCFVSSTTLRHWRQRLYVPSKRRAVSGVHGITTLKTAFFKIQNCWLFEVDAASNNRCAVCFTVFNANFLFVMEPAECRGPRYEKPPQVSVSNERHSPRRARTGYRMIQTKRSSKTESKLYFTQNHQ
jgi:hypothetical protein